MRNAKSHAFTLIELLVVITIIVVLLSLLAPAMDKAIYQAELLECGARQNATGKGVSQYAFENRRRYPDRQIRNRDSGSGVTWIPVMALTHPHDGYDMRPMLEPFLNINKNLQCPLPDPIELEDTDLDVALESSYAMWWGWQFKVDGAGAQSGMYKIGDRFSWGKRRFNILLGDIDLRYPESSQVSHPDRDPALMSLVTAEAELVFYTRASVSRWIGHVDDGAKARGLVDTNFYFDDGSVQRYDGVLNLTRAYQDRDERFDWVPLQFDERRPGDRIQIPPR